MRMPQTSLQPLPDHLEAIRQQVNALPDDERRALMGRLWSDTVRRNDARAQAAYERAEKLRNRKPVDSRQLRLMESAA